MVNIRKIFFIFLFLCISGSFVFGAVNIGGIDNFCKVEESFYRGAYPTEQGLQYLKQIGIKTIVDFRSPGRAVSQEKRLAEGLGIKYINIPFGFFRMPPEDSQIRKFIDIVKDPANRPIFVHCQHGRDRTGMMVATYRIVVQDWPKEKAYQEAKGYGFNPVYFHMKRFIFSRAEKFKVENEKKS